MAHTGSEGSGSPNTGFRTDIQGLRAVAVLLVLLFHAEIPGFSGGFIGVDVFFVISGFLITGMLLREIETTGWISLPNFYARRIRRLMPAAWLVLIVTLIASFFMLPPLSIPGVARDIASAALYVSNIVFAFRATDYFAAGAAPSPVLHFWSLGVEEQYYVFWPIIFLFAANVSRRARLRVGLVLTLIALSSFAFATHLVSTAGPWAFFSLPTRAWEFAVGGLVAVGGTGLSHIPKFVAATLGWLGLIAVVGSGIFINVSAPFPSYPALLPTLGATALIIGGSRETLFGPMRLLSTAIMQFFGKISYSLYLWHWPLLILPLAMKGLPLSIYERITLAIAAVPLAYLTYHWIENPFRRGKLIGTKPRRNLITAGALALMIAGASAGVGAYANNEMPGTNNASASTDSLKKLNSMLEGQETSTGTGSSTQPDVRPITVGGPVPGNLKPSLTAAKTDRAQSYLDRCHTQENQPPSTASCLYGDTTSSTTIVLFGDSHALSWFPAVNRAAKALKWRLLSLTMSACSPADIPGWNSANSSVMENCTLWRKESIAKIISVHPLLVLVTGTRGFATIDTSGNVLTGDAKTAAWRAGMIRTIDQLKSGSQDITYLTDTPSSVVDPPVCLSAHPQNMLACTTPVDQAIQRDWVNAESALSIEEGVSLIDTGLWVCPSSPCPVVLGNLLIYSDPGHLTATFSEALGNRMKNAIAAIHSSG